MLSRDGVAGLVCFATAVLLWWVARGLPQPALVPIGPGFYPSLLFTVTAVLGAALVITDALARGRRVPSPPVAYRLVLITFAVFSAYVFLLPQLGYRVATLGFVAVLQAALETPRTARRWGLVVVMAIATTAVTYYVFEAYLNVLLPRGRLTGF